MFILIIFDYRWKGSRLYKIKIKLFYNEPKRNDDEHDWEDRIEARLHNHSQRSS